MVIMNGIYEREVLVLKVGTDRNWMWRRFQGEKMAKIRGELSQPTGGIGEFAGFVRDSRLKCLGVFYCRLILD